MSFVNYEGYTLQDGLDSVREGWANLVREAFENKPENIKIVQVKEKFGGLRIYTDYHIEEFENLLQDIERRSFTICDVCGKPGTPRAKGFWIRTTCDEDYERR